VELPHVEQLYKELKSQGFGLITVTRDESADVKRMVDYNGITHPIVSDNDDPDTGSVFEKYHAYDGKHYIIGPDGTILAAFSKIGVSIPLLRRELAKYGGVRADAGTPHGAKR
jgi:peroxiredoxin